MDAVETLPAGWPQASIGAGAAGWMEMWLLSPDDPGEPLRLTDEQLRFLAWWMAVDGDGRWLFNSGVLRRPKGWGKDPFAAMICLLELLGPCRFGGHDAAGRPVGVPAGSPFVGIGGVAFEQTRTTTTMLSELVSPALAEAHRVRVGERRTTAVTSAGRRVEIRPITSSARTVEGARFSAFVSNETHLWLESGGGHKLADVIRRNLAKSRHGARELAITNAHEVGAGSVAERAYESWRLDPDGSGVLMDAREPVLGDGFDWGDEAAVTAALECAFGDAWWAPIQRMAAECADPETPEALRRRFWLNLLVAGEGAWLEPSALDAARSDGGTPDDGESVAVGFDGSVSGDSTAVVAVGMESGWIWLAGIWEHPAGDDSWTVPRHEVHGCLERVFDQWRVARMYADRAHWEQQVASWQARWPQVTAWDFSAVRAVKTARATAALRTAISLREATWGGPDAETLRRHMLNAVERPLYGTRSEDGRLHVIAKESRRSPRKIDAAHAAVLAWQARLDAIADGWRRTAPFGIAARSGPPDPPTLGI